MTSLSPAAARTKTMGIPQLICCGIPVVRKIQRLLLGGWCPGLVVFVPEVVLEGVAWGVVRLVVDFFLVFEGLVPF